MSHEHAESVGPTTVSVALSGAPTASLREGARPWGADELLRRAAFWMHDRGVTSLALVGFGATLAATAAFVFLSGHAGLGGVLALVALISSELALVQPPVTGRDSTRLVRGANPAIDMMMLAGIFGGIAVRHGALLIVLSFFVLVLLSWLPLLRSTAGPVRLAETSGLWRRGERMGILLLAVLLGRPAPALLMLLVVCGLDAWLRIERVIRLPGMGAPMSSQYVQQFVGEDGSFTPAARWLTLGVTLLAVLFLPQSNAWRF